MKKSILIVGIIILILIVAGGVYYLNPSKKNRALIDEYPILKDNQYLSHLLGMANETMNIEGEIIGYDFTTEKFNCNNKEITPIKVSSASCPLETEGCGLITSIVDCGDFYLVYEFSSSNGPRIFGPFKNTQLVGGCAGVQNIHQAECCENWAKENNISHSCDRGDGIWFFNYDSNQCEWECPAY